MNMSFLSISNGCTFLKVLFNTDHKDKLEADNQNLLRTFGSRLDDSLGDLHKVIHGLIFQQQQQLRGMEEHVSSFLASKCDVRYQILSYQSTFSRTKFIG